jgi:hypothetical protein
VPDYLADFREITLRGSGSDLRKQRVLKQIEKFRRDLKAVGGDVNKPGPDGEHPQLKFVRAMYPDGDPDDIREMMYRFCVARLVRGDFTDWTGWEFRNDWAIKSYGAGVSEKRWRLEKVKTLAILGEQGIGDEIMYASCIEDVQKLGIEVTVECDPRLCSVLERLGVKAKPRPMQEDDASLYLSRPREEEKILPMGDLPRLFRKRIGDFPWKPYLTPLPEFVAKWSHLKGRTGLAWRGRTGKTEPQAFGIENPVCLQYDAWEFETEGMTVPDCDLKNGIEDLLGICANLERVVTVPQTIVHLAGSIGKRVDVVLAPVGSGRVEQQIPWRYIDPMPWYPNVRVHANVGVYRRARSKS